MTSNQENTFSHQPPWGRWLLDGCEVEKGPANPLIRPKSGIPSSWQTNTPYAPRVLAEDDERLTMTDIVVRCLRPVSPRGPVAHVLQPGANREHKWCRGMRYRRVVSTPPICHASWHEVAHYGLDVRGEGPFHILLKPRTRCEPITRDHGVCAET